MCLHAGSGAVAETPCRPCTLRKAFPHSASIERPRLPCRGLVWPCHWQAAPVLYATSDRRPAGVRSAALPIHSTDQMCAPHTSLRRRRYCLARSSSDSARHCPMQFSRPHQCRIHNAGNDNDVIACGSRKASKVRIITTHDSVSGGFGPIRLKFIPGR